MNTATGISRIRGAQSFVANLYPNEDRTIDYIYGYLARNSGYLCKHIWQKKVTTDDFMKVISWLFAICEKMDIDLEDAYISRFPGVCPYCITSPCDCRNTKKSPVSYVPAYKIEEELNAKANVFRNTSVNITFDFVYKQSDDIYPNNQIIWEYGGPWRHLVKIQEEISEIHEAISGVINTKMPKSLLGDEDADAFAWVMSAWRITFIDRSFHDDFISYYYKGCPVCFGNPCECSKRAERAAEFIDPSVFAELRENMQLLTDEIGLKDSEIDELKNSLKAAENNQSEPIARGAVEQARKGLDKIESSVNFAERNSKKAATIVTAISQILSKLPF